MMTVGVGEDNEGPYNQLAQDSEMALNEGKNYSENVADNEEKRVEDFGKMGINNEFEGLKYGEQDALKDVSTVQIKEELQDANTVQIKEEFQDVNTVQIKEEFQDVNTVQIKEEFQDVNTVQIKEELQDVDKIQINEELQNDKEELQIKEQLEDLKSKSNHNNFFNIEYSTEDSNSLTEEEFAELQYESQLSLAQRLRPQSLDEYIGQLDLLGEGGTVTHYFEEENIDKIRSLILWGPPGVGKTSLAKIIMKRSNLVSYEFLASLDSINQIKPIISKLEALKKYTANEREQLKSRVILFIDEIHRYNKAQQDFLLDAIDRNLVVLIGATTENPSFSLVRPLLSRCLVLTLSQHSVQQVESIIQKGIQLLNKTRSHVFHFPMINFSSSAINYLAKISNGDLRNALKLLELSFLSLTQFDPTTKQVIHEEQTVSEDDLKRIVSKKFINFDAKGDQHYDTISAFHKSVRGSDVNASLYYLMRMLKGGDDPLYICRRIVRIASEDIGVIDSNCLIYCCNVYESVLRLGMPKSLKLLVQCTIRIAKSPKSVEIYRGWNMAKEVARTNSEIEVPFHLTDEASKLYNKVAEDNVQGDISKLSNDPKYYKYNLHYKHGLVDQNYLPDNLKGTKVLLGTHLGTQVDPELNDQQSDSEPDFMEDNFYRRKRQKLSFLNGQKVLAQSSSQSEDEGLTDDLAQTRSCSENDDTDDDLENDSLDNSTHVATFEETMSDINATRKILFGFSQNEDDDADGEYSFESDEFGFLPQNSDDSDADDGDKDDDDDGEDDDYGANVVGSLSGFSPLACAFGRRKLLRNIFIRKVNQKFDTNYDPSLLKTNELDTKTNCKRVRFIEN